MESPRGHPKSLSWLIAHPQRTGARAATSPASLGPGGSTAPANPCRAWQVLLARKNAVREPWRSGLRRVRRRRRGSPPPKPSFGCGQWPRNVQGTANRSNDPAGRVRPHRKDDRKPQAQCPAGASDGYRFDNRHEDRFSAPLEPVAWRTGRRRLLRPGG